MFRKSVQEPWNAAQFQLGAVHSDRTFNADGSTTYRVTNRMTTNSFFYHIPGIFNDLFKMNLLPESLPRDQNGNFGTITQVFEWTEDAST